MWSFRKCNRSESGRMDCTSTDRIFACRMTEQLDIFNQPPRRVIRCGPQQALDESEPSRIDREWLAFHEANPHVYEALVRFAREAAARRTHFGIGMLWERLRWYTSIEAHDQSQSEWELNNNFRSRYSRLLMAREPDLEGLFETRKLRSGCGLDEYFEGQRRGGSGHDSGG